MRVGIEVSASMCEHPPPFDGQSSFSLWQQPQCIFARVCGGGYFAPSVVVPLAHIESHSQVCPE